jgi:hypothetical protein
MLESEMLIGNMWVVKIEQVYDAHVQCQGSSNTYSSVIVPKYCMQDLLSFVDNGYDYYISSTDIRR